MNASNTLKVRFAQAEQKTLMKLQFGLDMKKLLSLTTTQEVSNSGSILLKLIVPNKPKQYIVRFNNIYSKSLTNYY